MQHFCDSPGREMRRLPSCLHGLRWTFNITGGGMEGGSAGVCAGNGCYLMLLGRGKQTSI